MNRMLKYRYTFLYMLFIVCINSLFVYLPQLTLCSHTYSPADFFVGVIYVLRDLSQREIKHWVLAAMLLGCGFSYLLPEKAIALASLIAFIVGEFLDWGIYTFTKKPLSERIVLSSLFSVPLDSLVFLLLIHQLNFLNFLFLLFSKSLGVLTVWYMWKFRQNKLNSSNINTPYSYSIGS